MRRLSVIVLKLALTLLILGTALWGAGFLYFRLPGTMAGLAAIGFGVAALAGLVGVWSGEARLPLGFAVLFVSLLGWWSSFHPSHDRDWIPAPACRRSRRRATSSPARTCAISAGARKKITTSTGRRDATTWRRSPEPISS